MELDIIVVVNDSLYSSQQLRDLLTRETRIDQIIEPAAPGKLRVAELLAKMTLAQYKKSLRQLRTSPDALLTPIKYIIVTDHPQDWKVLDSCQEILYYILLPPQIVQPAPRSLPTYTRAVLEQIEDLGERGVVLRGPTPEDYASTHLALDGIAYAVDLTPDDAMCIVLFEPNNLEAVERLAALTQHLEGKGDHLQFWKDYELRSWGDFGLQKVTGGSYLGALSTNKERPLPLQILRRPEAEPRMPPAAPEPRMPPAAPESRAPPAEMNRCRLKLYCTKTGVGNECGYWHPAEEREELVVRGSKKPRNVYLCSKHDKVPESSIEHPRCTYAHTQEELFCTFCEHRGHHYSRCPEAKAE